MTNRELHDALRDLDGQRDLQVVFADVFSAGVTAPNLTVKRAELLPGDADSSVRLSDGKKTYILDAARIACLVVG